MSDDTSNVVDLVKEKKKKETKAIVTREQARQWKKDKTSIETACRGGAEAAWQIGAILADVEKRGTWKAELDATTGARAYKSFRDVIEGLTPWKRAFGYQLIALAKTFTVQQTLKIGQSKALRLAAAVQVTSVAEDSSDDDKRIHQDVLDLVTHVQNQADEGDHATVAFVDAELGRILGKKERSPRAPKAQTEKHKVGDGAGTVDIAIGKDGMTSFTLVLKDGGRGVMIGQMQISDTVDLMVEVHGGNTCRVSIIVPEPDDKVGQSNEGDNDDSKGP